MKAKIIGMLALFVLASGCANKKSSVTIGDNWLSGPELESRLIPLAEDFAKQHKIDFDFTGTHCRIACHFRTTFTVARAYLWMDLFLSWPYLS